MYDGQNIEYMKRGYRADFIFSPLHATTNICIIFSSSSIIIYIYTSLLYYIMGKIKVLLRAFYPISGVGLKNNQRR